MSLYIFSYTPKGLSSGGSPESRWLVVLRTPYGEFQLADEKALLKIHDVTLPSWAIVYLVVSTYHQPYRLSTTVYFFNT